MREAPRRILLIEDSPAEGECIRDVLSDAGYAVAVEEDAERGLEEARREVPALIVLNVRRSAVDAWEAARRLKTDPLTAPVPVLAIVPSRVSRQKLASARWDAALHNPVTAESLVAGVRSLLGES